MFRPAGFAPRRVPLATALMASTTGALAVPVVEKHVEFPKTM